MGDNFTNIHNAIITNRSTVTNAFNKVKETHDEETALVLLEIKKIVEDSKSKDAEELNSSFNEEVAKEKPKKSLLKSIWKSLTDVLPTLATAAGIVEKVMKIIS